MKPWICSVCGGEASPNGYIEIANANPELGPVGAYPIDASPDRPPWEEPGGEMPAQWEQHAQLRGAHWLIERPVNIRFRVVCPKCSDKNAPAYSFQVPATIDGYIAWLFHLQEKTWIGHFDTLAMLRFWYRGHGQDPPKL